MAPLTPGLLREYIQVLKDLGVRRYQWGELVIELGPSDQPEARPIGPRPVLKDTKTLFENPSLWPGGAPPKFPGQD